MVGPIHMSNCITSSEGKKSISKSLFFQPQLTVGPVDDVYEREADSVADKVMRMGDEEEIQTKISPINVQRKCADCEEEEHVQRKENVESDGLNAPSIVSDALNTSGAPLENETKSFMESRFGYDFSNVKVHTDSVAAESAQSINALAYTSGNNIVFNNGQYAPNTDSGKRLLAHELTHVVQQQSQPGLMKKIQRKSVWNQKVPISTDHLLIFDVDDGDFVGGCVKQVVPHGGIKLVEKGVKHPIFDIHFGVFKNAVGEFCMFFYESISRSCVTECSDDLKKILEKFAEWIKEKINEFLDALDKVGRFLLYLIQLALMAAIAAMMIILAGMLLALA